MDTPTTDDVQRALQTLADGLPGRNAPRPFGPSGELDNPEVRQLLADAALTVLIGSDPAKVFDDLAHYFDDAERGGWFGNKRAEVILELLAYQGGYAGWTSWLAGHALQLQKRVTRPDRRWLEVCSRLIRAFPAVDVGDGHHLLPPPLNRLPNPPQRLVPLFNHLATALAEGISKVPSLP
ncbi:MAG: hypothetical protein QM820_06435 [Minicystis sp.]